MPSIKHNKNWWESYPWVAGGDEWSDPWGGAEAQWHGSLFPRIQHYLPARNVLEIACGFGRWTQFLKDHCEKLTAVDIADNCIAACRDRFAEDDQIRFITNDGATVPEVENASVDFVFSFDSLVHADRAALTSYLAEIRRVLSPGGVAFIHHSNFGAYSRMHANLERVPKLTGALLRMHVVEFTHFRDTTVDARFVAAAASRAGVRCIGQEIIPWLTKRTLIDCISVIVPTESPAARPNRIVRNLQFSREPAYVSQLASVYDPDLRPGSTR